MDRWTCTQTLRQLQTDEVLRKAEIFLNRWLGLQDLNTRIKRFINMKSRRNVKSIFWRALLSTWKIYKNKLLHYLEQLNCSKMDSRRQENNQGLHQCSVTYFTWNLHLIVQPLNAKDEVSRLENMVFSWISKPPEGYLTLPSQNNRSI